MMDGDLAAMVMVLVMSSPAFSLGFAELCRPHSRITNRDNQAVDMYLVHVHIFK